MMNKMTLYKMALSAVLIVDCMGSDRLPELSPSAGVLDMPDSGTMGAFNLAGRADSAAADSAAEPVEAYSQTTNFQKSILNRLMEEGQRRVAASKNFEILDTQVPGYVPSKLFGKKNEEEGVQRKELITTLSEYLGENKIVLAKFLGKGSNKRTFAVSGECFTEEFPKGCVAKICKHTETNDMEEKVYEQCKLLGDKNFLTKTLFYQVGDFVIQVQEGCDTTAQEEYCFVPFNTSGDLKETQTRLEECRDRNLELAYLATSIGVELKDFTAENIMRTKATNVWKVADFEFELAALSKFNPLDTVARDNMHLATEIMKNCYKDIRQKLKAKKAKAKKTPGSRVRRMPRRNISRKMDSRPQGN